MSKIKTKITSQDLRRLILERHKIGSKKAATGASSATEWAVFFELRNGTGYGRQERYLDAFAFNMYPSKKFWRISYEFKVTRSDFLAELSKPEKRDFGLSISNEFYFVCPPGVAKREEIPEGCGLLEVSGKRLKRVVVAKQREAADLTMREVAAIARQSVGALDYSAVKWRYAGCELSEEALDTLVEERMDRHIQDQIREQIENQVQNRLSRLLWALENSKKAVEEAGLPPLPWMRTVESMCNGKYNATLPGASHREMERWVQENVHPGPNAQELSHALQEHDRLKNSLESLQHRYKRLFSDMSAQVDEATKALHIALEKQDCVENVES